MTSAFSWLYTVSHFLPSIGYALNATPGFLFLFLSSEMKNWIHLETTFLSKFPEIYILSQSFTVVLSKLKSYYFYELLFYQVFPKHSI